MLSRLSFATRVPRAALFSRVFHGSFNENNPKIGVTFVLKDGSKKTVQAPIEANVLEVAHHYEIDLEGACECSLACSTCHVILDEKTFDSIPEATEREEDLLDMAPSLTDTSRLGCQVIITKDMDGMTVRLPTKTRNFYVDGHVPKPH